MGALPKPTVPAGPVQSLFAALHDLHHRAGWPSLRVMAREVGCSHTTISAAFSEPRVPRWGLLELIVEMLDGDVDRFHQLWMAASESGESGPEPHPTEPNPTEPHPTEPHPAEPVAVPPVTAAPAPITPRQLPADVLGFVGRTEPLAELNRLLRRSGAAAAVGIAVVAGTAGVGKTALAVRWAHQVADQFPDGQLYANLRGFGPDQPASPADVLAGFLRALGQDDRTIPQPVDERAALYRTRSAGRRMLVLLDNARSAEQVRDLLPGAASCFVLVTSRDTLPGLVARNGAQRVNLDLLPATDAVGLLRMLAGPRVDDEPEQAATLAWRCARLPLALRIAAELAVSRPSLSLAALAAELGDEQGRLDLLDAGEDEHTAVRATFRASYRQLDPAAADAFRLLGLHPGREVDGHAVAALAGAAPAAATRMLTTLARAHLVEEVRPGRFGMHDLLRVYAAEQAAELAAADQAAALARLFDYYLSAAADASWDWLETERANLLDVARTAAQRSPAHAGRLSAVLAPYLDARGHYRDALALHELALHAAEADRDVAGTAHAQHRLATAHRRLGDYHLASEHYRAALRRHRETGDRAGEADALQGMGTVDWRLARYGDALSNLTAALALRRQLADRSGEGNALYSLGIVNRRLGRYQEALALYEQALAIHSELGDLTGQGRALGNLGVVQVRLGRYEAAVDCHERSLAIHRQLGDRVGEAVSLTNLGTSHDRLGRYQQALALYQQALAIYRETGYRVGEADALHGIGVAHRRADRPDRALPPLREAVAIAHRIGEVDLEIQVRNDLAVALRDCGQPDQALTHHRSALSLAETTGDRYEQARALEGIGEIQRRAGNPADAHRDWQAALRHYTELEVPEAAGLRRRLAAAQVSRGRGG